MTALFAALGSKFFVWPSCAARAKIEKRLIKLNFGQFLDQFSHVFPNNGSFKLDVTNEKRSKLN